jgi:hypothetical protein
VEQVVIENLFIRLLYISFSNSAGLPVSITSYPITVGGGGSGGDPCGVPAASFRTPELQDQIQFLVQLHLLEVVVEEVILMVLQIVTGRNGGSGGGGGASNGSSRWNRWNRKYTTS